MLFLSYAQNFEDIMLRRALKGVNQGFYIDVGANHPDIDSVTRAFYDLGWSGINIEPAKEFFPRLASARSRDFNLEIALGEQSGELMFYQVNGTGLSTTNTAIAESYKAEGWDFQSYSIKQRTLAEVCAEHAPSVIHFLKVDVGGEERDVLLGADFKRFRPWVILVAATRPRTQKENFDNWEAILLEANYEFAYFDGLNRFYIATEHFKELHHAFLLPPNFFDNFMRAADTEFVQKIAETRQWAQAEIQTLRIQLANEHAAELKQMGEEQENFKSQVHAKQISDTEEIEKLSQWIRSLQNSASWRITAPIRFAKRIIFWLLRKVLKKERVYFGEAKIEPSILSAGSYLIYKRLKDSIKAFEGEKKCE